MARPFIRRILALVAALTVLASVVFHFAFPACPVAVTARPAVAHRLRPSMLDPGLPGEARLGNFAVRRSVSPVPESAGACFQPRMAFTFGSGANRVDVLICLECRWVRFYEGDRSVSKPLSADGIRRLAAIDAMVLGPDTGPESTFTP